MTTDPFTDAAHAEAERRWSRDLLGDDVLPGPARMNRRIGFDLGARWARDHLAAQEPTSTGAGAGAVRALHTGTRWPGVTDKPICDECDRPWPCLTIRALDGDA